MDLFRFREKHTLPQTYSGPLQNVSAAVKCGVVSFYGLDNFIANKWEEYSIWDKGQGFPGIGPWPTFWPLMVGLRTVMALVGVSFSMLIYYNEHIMRLKVYWKFNLPPSWTQLVLTSLCHVLWPYHSFKCCALLPSLLFQPHLIYSTLLPIINHPRVSHKWETQNPLPRTAMGVTNFF